MGPGGITSLPLELQEYILSFLPFSSRIRAIRTCRSWESLLSTRRQLASRYLPLQPADKNHIPGVHLLLDAEGNLRITVKNRKVTRLEFLSGEDGDGGEKWVDVRNHPMLKDPVFSPYLDISNTFTAQLRNFRLPGEFFWEMFCFWEVGGKEQKVCDIIEEFRRGLVEKFRYYDDDDGIEYEIQLKQLYYERKGSDSRPEGFTIAGTVKRVQDN